MSKISVLGLGLMGSALARTLVGAGEKVTVWNRSPGKAGQLGALGASVAPSADEAVREADTVIVCVTDYAASARVLETATLHGKLVVQLSTGTPREARAGAGLAQSRGAAYLDGAIIAVPSQIGRPESTLFVAGPDDAYQRGAATLQKLVGTVVHVGREEGARRRSTSPS